MIDDNHPRWAGKLQRLLAAMPRRSSRPPSRDISLIGFIAPELGAHRLPSFRRDAAPATPTSLLTCIKDLERTSADLKKIVMSTGGVIGSSLRQQHFELEEVVHKLARIASP